MNRPRRDRLIALLPELESAAKSGEYRNDLAGELNLVPSRSASIVSRSGSRAGSIDTYRRRRPLVGLISPLRLLSAFVTWTVWCFVLTSGQRTGRAREP